MLNSPRLTKSMPPAAMVIAILALLAATAGVGYTAATIGTNDLQNDAVTSPKVKDGTLRQVDLVKDPKFKYVGGSGVNFSDGGEDDCVWQSGHTLLPGIAKVGYRTDRFGTVHLSGVAVGSNGSGGDATCDATVQSEDGLVFVLPAASRPAKTQIIVIGDAGTIIVAGKNGLIVPPTIALAPGAVFWQGSPSFGVLLDGISYPGPTAKVYGKARPGTQKVTPGGRALLRNLGVG